MIVASNGSNSCSGSSFTSPRISSSNSKTNICCISRSCGSSVVVVLVVAVLVVVAAVVMVVLVVVVVLLVVELVVVFVVRTLLYARMYCSLPGCKVNYSRCAEVFFIKGVTIVVRPLIKKASGA